MGKIVVSRDGVVTKGGIPLNQNSGNGQGRYLKVFFNGKHHLVHRLVAKEYIPNPNNLPEVNHINKDTQDNRVENLEWVDRQTHNRKDLGVGIILIKDGVIKGFNSRAECAEFLGRHPAHVSRFVRGLKGKVCNGWEVHSG